MKQVISIIALSFLTITTYAASGGGGVYQNYLQFPTDYYSDLYTTNGFSTPVTQLVSFGGFGVGDEGGNRGGGGGSFGSFTTSNGTDKITGTISQGGFLLGKSFGFSFLKVFADLKFNFGAATLKVETASGQNGTRVVSFFSPTPSIGMQVQVLPFLFIAASVDYVTYLRFSDSNVGDTLGTSPLPGTHLAGNVFLVFGGTQ